MGDAPLTTGTLGTHLTADMLLEAWRSLQPPPDHDPVVKVHAGDDAIAVLRRGHMLIDSPGEPERGTVPPRVGFLAGIEAPVYRVGIPDVLLLYHASGTVSMVQEFTADHQPMPRERATFNRTTLA